MKLSRSWSMILVLLALNECLSICLASTLLPLEVCKSTCASDGYPCSRQSGCQLPSCQLGCEIATSTNKAGCKSACEAAKRTCFYQPAGFATADLCTAGTCPGGSFQGNCEDGSGCPHACSLMFPEEDSHATEADALTTVAEKPVNIFKRWRGIFQRLKAYSEKQEHQREQELAIRDRQALWKEVPSSEGCRSETHWGEDQDHCCDYDCNYCGPRQYCLTQHGSDHGVCQADFPRCGQLWRQVEAYEDLGRGKCIVKGQDPVYSYHPNEGRNCKELCDAENNCHGYSLSVYGNCLLWRQPGLSAGGAEWGGAHCHIKPSQAVSLTFSVAGAGGVGAACNGNYSYVGKYNGKPTYRMQNGQAIIYFNSQWKINFQDDKFGWFYEHPDSSSFTPPTGQWTTAGYSNGDADPAPVVKVLYTSKVGYEFAGEGNCGPGSKRTFVNTDIDTCRSLCSADASCTGYDMDNGQDCSLRSFAISAVDGSPTAKCWKKSLQAPPVGTGDVFTGQYSCLQGLTGLRLTINAWPDAQFEFFPTFGSRHSCSGKFNLTGSWDQRRKVMSFSAGPWITNPCDFDSVGLAGSLTANGNSYAGHIIQGFRDETCTTFSATKAKRLQAKLSHGEDTKVVSLQKFLKSSQQRAQAAISEAQLLRQQNLKNEKELEDIRRKQATLAQEALRNKTAAELARKTAALLTSEVLRVEHTSRTLRNEVRDQRIQLAHWQALALFGLLLGAAASTGFAWILLKKSRDPVAPPAEGLLISAEEPLLGLDASHDDWLEVDGFSNKAEETPLPCKTGRSSDDVKTEGTPNDSGDGWVIEGSKRRDEEEAVATHGETNECIHQTRAS